MILNKKKISYPIISVEGTILLKCMQYYLDEDVHMFSTILLGLGYKYSTYMRGRFSFLIHHVDGSMRIDMDYKEYKEL